MLADDDEDDPMPEMPFEILSPLNANKAACSTPVKGSSSNMWVPSDISEFLEIQHERKYDDARNGKFEEIKIDQTLDDEEETFLQEDFEELDNIDCIVTNTNEQPESPASRFSSMQYGDLNEELEKIASVKCLATLDQLKALLGNVCRTAGCGASLFKIDHYVLQYCLKLEWFCTNKHRGIWYSSPFYAGGLAVNYIVDTALLMSGGQITQFKRMCKFINLGKPTITSFYRNQRLYVSPTVEQGFNEMRCKIIQRVTEQGGDIVVCGDGRMDSPGFSATKGSYTIMNYETNELLTMEFGDAREVISPRFLKGSFH